MLWFFVGYIFSILLSFIRVSCPFVYGWLSKPVNSFGNLKRQKPALIADSPTLITEEGWFWHGHWQE
jgi:hypothetical protein